MRYRFGGLIFEGVIHGGAYFRNFMVFSESISISRTVFRFPSEFELEGFYYIILMTWWWFMHFEPFNTCYSVDFDISMVACSFRSCSL